MRKLIAIVLCLPQLGWGAIKRIQPATSGSTTQGVCSLSSAATTNACSFTTTPTVGNLIFVICSAITNETWSLPTDNQTGNTYVNVAAATGSESTTASSGLWYAIVNGASGTFTVTCHASASNLQTALLLEYSGLNTTSPLDIAAGAGGTGTAMSPGILNTTNANDLILGDCINENATSGTATFTPAAGFTIQNQQTNDTSFVNVASEDQIVSATGGYTASMTYSLNSTDVWWCGVGAFKAGAGGSSCLPPFCGLLGTGGI